VTVLAGVDADTEVIEKFVPAEIAAVSSPSVVDPLIPIRLTNTLVFAVTDVLATVTVPETSVAWPILELVPSVSFNPDPIALQIRFPVVAVKSPVTSCNPPLPFGVTVKDMFVFDPVADRALPARSELTVAAPVVRFVTEGVSDPPRESQVADPEELEARA
jgi:hypothetical protein